MTQIKFGTDGWRAIIAEEFTFSNVRLCAQSVAEYLHDTGQAAGGLVVGYDTRFASPEFAAAVAQVVAANGIPVYLCRRPAPTPVVSYTIQRLGASGGVVITASHNPAAYNGFKVKGRHAGSASVEVVAELERLIPLIQQRNGVKEIPLSQGLEQGTIRSVDPAPAYLRHVRRLVGEDRLEAIRRADIHIVVDSMHGAGAGYFRRLLTGGATRLTEIHRRPDPSFGGVQPEPIARNLGRLMRLVPRTRAHVGLASDGDADRLGVVDETGGFVTQLQVFALLALYLLEVLGQRGPLIKTITTSSMLYRLGELFGVEVRETDVGFKYVGPEMLRLDALIGGEESGGYGFRGHIPERDSILAGLYFLDLMVTTGRTPHLLVDYLYQKVGPHHYDRADLHFALGQRDAIIQRILESHPRQLTGGRVAREETFRGEDEAVSGARFTLEDGSWLLIRFSGTEPLLRIYAETDSPSRVDSLLAEGRRFAGMS